MPFEVTSARGVVSSLCAESLKSKLPILVPIRSRCKYSDGPATWNGDFLERIRMCLISLPFRLVIG